MNNRLTKLFNQKSKNLLSIYYTAGYPNLDDTISIAGSLATGGADIIEVGIPFSDPVADGPTIQASNKIALDHGMNLKLLLEQIRVIRKQNPEIPLVLMGYLNPVMQYGVEDFLKDASGAGVDGVIIPDLPIYEFEKNYKALFKSYDISNTFLISPTTSDARIKQIDAITDGFIYAVSSSSTTGARDQFSNEQLEYFERLKHLKLQNPFLIGFGISNYNTFSKAVTYGAGAIVGSAFIALLKEEGASSTAIHAFIKKLKGE